MKYSFSESQATLSLAEANICTYYVIVSSPDTWDCKPGDLVVKTVRDVAFNLRSKSWSSSGLGEVRVRKPEPGSKLTIEF